MQRAAWVCASRLKPLLQRANRDEHASLDQAPTQGGTSAPTACGLRCLFPASRNCNALPAVGAASAATACRQSTSNNVRRWFDANKAMRRAAWVCASRLKPLLQRANRDEHASLDQAPTQLWEGLQSRLHRPATPLLHRPGACTSANAHINASPTDTRRHPVPGRLRGRCSLARTRPRRRAPNAATGRRYRRARGSIAARACPACCPEPGSRCARRCAARAVARGVRARPRSPGTGPAPRWPGRACR